MSHFKLALLGFGNVGQALARLLLSKQAELKRDYDLTFDVTGLATGRHGSAIDLAGLDLEKALAIMATGGSLNDLGKGMRRSIRLILFAAAAPRYYSKIRRSIIKPANQLLGICGWRLNRVCMP